MMKTASKATFTGFLLQQGILKFGDFTLKDGSKSPFFLDFGALASGAAFRQMGEFFSAAIKEHIGLEKVDFVFGPPYKAIMLAGSTAMACQSKELPCLFRRKEAKQHGEGGDFYGHTLQAGQNYVLIDDVMSSGGTKVEAMKALPDQKCLAVLVGVDREHKAGDKTVSQRFTADTGVPVVSLIKLGALCSNLQGLVTDEQHRAMEAFCQA